MTFHPEVMPPAQQEVLRTISPFASERGFYLAGGTAVAIQMGHRRSVDLDWFTDGEVEPMGLAADLRAAGIPLDVSDLGKGTLHGAVQGVKLSFLEYRYPLLVHPVEWPEYQVRIAGLEDLACMKLSAIGGRGVKRDFIDLYALGREHFSLAEMLGLYQRKYGLSDVGHTVVALTWFDDAEDENTPELIWRIDWDEVKRTIEGWVRDYVQ